jgi:hypothetical protein
MTTVGSEPRARVDDEHCPAVRVEAGVAQFRHPFKPASAIAGRPSTGKAAHFLALEAEVERQCNMLSVEHKRR